MPVEHRELAHGRWQLLSLAEQLGNIGSEVSRAAAWQGRDRALYAAALDRALELLDLTIADPRHRVGRPELTRVRELLAAAAYGGESYGTTLADLDRYFLAFALVARRGR